jgi:MFS family permease
VEDVRELLAERDFRMLLGAQYVGHFADGLAQAVIATVLVLDPLQAGTPERVLAIFALTLLPYSVISPFLGVFVDRWDRKKLLLGTHIARTGVLVTAPLWQGALPGDSSLLLIGLLLLGLGRLFSTTKGAVLPVLLHEHHLLHGNNLSSVGGTIAALVGGAAGLWLGDLIDPSVVLPLIGIVYLGGALIAATLRSDLTHPHEHFEGILEAMARIARELVEGMREISARPRAWISLLAVFLLRTIGMTVLIALLLVIKSEFEGTLASSGFGLGAFGVGAGLAALSAPRISDRLSEPQMILLGFVVPGIGVVAIGGLSWLPAVLTVAALGGYGGFLTKVSVDAQVQAALPDSYRGRAFALYDILYNLASVVAAAAIVLFESVAFRPLLIGIGVVNLAVVPLLAVLMRRHSIPLSLGLASH